MMNALNPSSQLRILAVDDDEIDLVLLCQRVPTHCTFTFAHDGIEALEMLSKNNFDLVILDLKMPRMSGFECLAEIRKRNQKLPVVVLTSSSHSHDVDEATRLGATKYIVKPVSCGGYLEALLDAIAAINEPPMPLINIAEDELAGPVIMNVTAAFIHKLTSEFRALTAHVRALGALLSDAEGKQKLQLLETGGLIENRLDAARYLLERFRNAMGRHPGLLRAVDIHTVLLDVQRQFQPRSSNRVTLHATEGSCWVMGDVELLWHLFENLIRNGLEAVEDRRDGQVNVTIHNDKTESILRVVVDDNGSGIPPDVLPRIFEMNYTTKPKGLGIGLYLAQRAATIHGGRIECASDSKVGTKFTISLPALKLKRVNLAHEK